MIPNDPMVDVLDANGEVIGQASKAEVQQRKLFHRVAGLIVSLRNSVKADSIHVLVNSNLHQVQSDLAVALHRISTLETVIATHHDR
mgnify:CR=1 FL=1